MLEFETEFQEISSKTTQLLPVKSIDTQSTRTNCVCSVVEAFSLSQDGNLIGKVPVYFIAGIQPPE
jgi:hypothetical protein